MDEKTQMSSKEQVQVFGVVLSACILCTLLQTVMNTALPAVMKEFQISAATVQWLTSGYTLTLGVMTPLTAYLLKRFPTRKLYLTSLLFFTVGILFSALANSFTVLMLGRILQAIGSSVIVSMTQVVIFHVFPKEKRGSMMGLYGLAIGAAPILAPTLAGIVIDLWGWRMVFLISLGVAALTILLGLLWMRNVLETARQKFDSLSMAECSVGLCGIMIGLGNISTYAFFSAYVALSLLIGIGVTLLFSFRQLKQSEPFLNLTLFKNREFTAGTIGSMLLYAGMMGASVLIPLYVQSARGLSATTSGIVTLPGSVVMLLVNPFAGKLYDKMGIRKLFILGSALMLAGCLGMSSLTMDTPLLLVVIMFAVRQAAIGCMMMPIATWAMSTLDKGATADGTAILTSLRTIAGSIGSAVFVSLSSAIAGATSLVHGLSISFLGISILAAVEVVFAICFVGKKRV